MNYAELKAAVIDFSHRQDLAASIPTFISLAHSKIMNDVDITTQQQWATLDSSNPVNTAGSIYTLPLPDNCHRITGVVANGKYIQQLPVDTLTRRYQTTGGGYPANYAIYGNRLWVAPGIGEIQIWYHERLPDLVADDDTNLVLTEYPQCYLYGALVHLQNYTQDAEQMIAASQLYDVAVADANRQMSTLAWGAAPTVAAG